MREKEPLYRKVNTRARGVHHDVGGDARHERNTKRARMSDDVKTSSMHGKRRRGLDYTPLFRFLLSKVGAKWDAVFSEASARLDSTEPVFWLVALREDAREAVVRMGESSYYSGLYVDDDGILQRVDPSMGPEKLEPSCACCTHTFNGAPFTKKHA